jgi:hypothetical protein
MWDVVVYRIHTHTPRFQRGVWREVSWFAPLGVKPLYSLFVGWKPLVAGTREAMYRKLGLVDVVEYT